jgi:hypothetical protein
MLCVDRALKRRDISDLQSHIVVVSGSMKNKTPWSVNQRKKRKLDPTVSAIPEKPLGGLGVGGRIGASQLNYMIKKMGMGLKKPESLEDPRDALLKYADIPSPALEEENGGEEDGQQGE